MNKLILFLFVPHRNKKLNIQHLDKSYEKNHNNFTIHISMAQPATQEDIYVQSGAFGSREIYINGNNSAKFIQLFELEKTTQKCAIFVYVNQYNLAAHLNFLLEQQIKFHHQEQKGENTYYMYYIWNKEGEDKVPVYGTANEGVAAVVLFQSTEHDEVYVLFVHEYGKLKLITGTVDRNELALHTAIREAAEECGVEVDKTFAPKFLGGLNKRNARFGLNDTFSAFVLRAATKEIKVDGDEIKKAFWLPISSIMQLTPNFDVASEVNLYSLGMPYDLVTVSDDGATVVIKETISMSGVQFVQNFVNGRFLETKVVGSVCITY